jgi:hypothetical protein
MHEDGGNNISNGPFDRKTLPEVHLTESFFRKKAIKPFFDDLFFR